MDTRSLPPEQCANLIRAARRAVAFTGAGISTAAGIPDFRGPEGIYATGKYDAERTFDVEHFRRDPRPFFQFARDMLAMTGEVEPTFTHRWLARLEADGLLEGVITQNIDPLHQMAGSQNVIAVHGTFGTAHCMDCRRLFTLAEFLERLGQQEIPRCDCGDRGVIKPDVVFFGEPVTQLEDAIALAGSCDLMLVLGSSLAVYPAAILPQLAGGELVVINQGDSGLMPGPRRHFVDSDLDEYTRRVAAALL